MGRLKTGKEATIRTQGGKVQRITTATMLAAMERAGKYLEEAVRWSQERDKTGAEGDQFMERHQSFLKSAGIPGDAWFPIEASFTDANRADVMAMLHYWGEGTWDSFGADYAKMEEDMDIDPAYILFGTPIRQLSVRDQAKLRNIGEEFAIRKLADRRRRRDFAGDDD